jgi:hypothetical protein
MPTNNLINSNFYEIANTDVNGTITGITVGNLTVTANTNLGSNSNITITGGSNGQILTSNGSGGIFWANTASGVAADFVSYTYFGGL